MQKNYILALDQGTTSSRAILFDHALQPVGAAQREFTQHYPQAGWVEHDPMEIFATQSAVLTEVLAQNGVSAGEVAAIGITNQRETTVLWEKESAKPVHPAIVWQCRRTAQLCERLKAAGLEREISERTGLVLDAYFSATKINWILECHPELKKRAERGEILFGTVDSWLIYKLSGGTAHITDHTNASRTLLYNLQTKSWDDRLLEIFDIPRAMLPTIVNSSGVFAFAMVDGVQIPVAGIAGDQQAALFGQGCFEAGEMKNTYGTGCFLLMNTGEKLARSRNGLLSTVAIALDSGVQYALEGSIFVGGAVIQWLRDELGLIKTAAQSEQLATQVANSGGVYLVPAFTGLGAPHWDMYARGVLTGMTRGSGRSHIVRAALESIAYQTMEVTRAMQADTGIPLRSLRVDGGACANNFLMQFQSDILDCKVIRPQVLESTALGAAALAGLGVGWFSGREELRRCLSVERMFSPCMTQETRRALCDGWNRAVRAARLQ